MEIMSEQENTSIQEIILSLKKSTKTNDRSAEHFNELLESREEDDEELKACATILSAA
jgi:hypothetical protein